MDEVVRVTVHDPGYAKSPWNRTPSEFPLKHQTVFMDQATTGKENPLIVKNYSNKPIHLHVPKSIGYYLCRK
jgi:hypothetical protein